MLSAVVLSSYLGGHVETVSDDTDWSPADAVERHFDAVRGAEQPAG